MLCNTLEGLIRHVCCLKQRCTLTHCKYYGHKVPSTLKDIRIKREWMLWQGKISRCAPKILLSHTSKNNLKEAFLLAWHNCNYAEKSSDKKMRLLCRKPPVFWPDTWQNVTIFCPCSQVLRWIVPTPYILIAASVLIGWLPATCLAAAILSLPQVSARLTVYRKECLRQMLMHVLPYLLA